MSMIHLTVRPLPLQSLYGPIKPLHFGMGRTLVHSEGWPVFRLHNRMSCLQLWTRSGLWINVFIPWPEKEMIKRRHSSAYDQKIDIRTLCTKFPLDLAFSFISLWKRSFRGQTTRLQLLWDIAMWKVETESKSPGLVEYLFERNSQSRPARTRGWQTGD